MATTGTWLVGSLNSMAYYLLLPDNYDPAQAYPVLLYLHGGGQESRTPSMTDPWFNTPEFRANYPAIVVEPIIQNSSLTNNWGAYPTPDYGNQETAVAIVRQVMATYSADPQRVYVTGLSLGGHGTWDLMIKYNAYDGTEGRIFAAGMPLAGGWTPGSYQQVPSQAIIDELRNVPIWAVNGLADNPLWDEAMAAALGTNGAYHFTEPNAGHDVWDTTYPLPYGKPYYDWMFSVVATNLGSTTPVATAQLFDFSHLAITSRTATEIVQAGTTVPYAQGEGAAFADVSLTGNFPAGAASYQDITGDGRLDLIVQTPDHVFYVAQGSGSGNTGGLGTPSVALTHGGPVGFIPNQTQFADIDGDGRVDSIFQGLDNRFWAAYGTDSGFSAPLLVAEQGGPFNPAQVQYADVNGDGRQDMIFQGVDNRFWVGFGTASGFTTPELAAVEGGPFNPQEVQFADVNGDGKADLIYQGVDNRFWISFGAADGFGPAVLGLTHGGPFIGGQARYADVNGDGRADTVFQGVDNRIWLSLSNGTGFDTPVQAASITQDGFDVDRLAVVDMNGDGKADLMYQTADNAFWEYVSTGASFDAGKLALDLPGTFRPGSAGYGDVNGDHLGDIVFQDTSNKFWVSLQSYDWAS